ncbi:MAG: WecB/TagA/CpsF family glycosyltransferase [Gammaproteobacteria bacterium]|nr:WecB/TagA/CpsF family glycosyltransferase [Gammaproteobacteria bacterium]
MNSNLTIFDIEISGKDKAQLSLEISDAIKNGIEPLTLACANPHSLVVSLDDALFKKALKSTNVLVADGKGVALAGRYVKKHPVERITGFDMFSITMKELERLEKSVFFFGSSDLVLNKIASAVGKDYPGVRLAGVLSPPFGEWSIDENNEMIERINKEKPDVLWVGMTAPKQEKWVEQNKSKLNVKVIGSIGAVFDFYAGTKPRAPAWMCSLGIEWLHRLIKEPKRMWKRNFISTPLFLRLLFKESNGK